MQCTLLRSGRMSLFWHSARLQSAQRGQVGSTAVSMSYRSVEYEVHGIVQGVWFRAHTVDKAKQLGLVGFVQNSPQGTVKGEVQGRPAAVEQMKGWLSSMGSPHSVIEKAEFRDERELEALEYSSFSTRR